MKRPGINRNRNKNRRAFLILRCSIDPGSILVNPLLLRRGEGLYLAIKKAMGGKMGSKRASNSGSSKIIFFVDKTSNKVNY